MKSIGEVLRDRWSARGVDIRPGVSLTVIESFERLNGVRLPADMRETFLVVDGMEENTSDGTELLFSFWPLHRLMPVSRRFTDPRDLHYTRVKNPQSFFCFADYMIEAEVFSIDLSVNASSNTIVGWEGALKAKSFSEFMESYLKNPESLIAK